MNLTRDQASFQDMVQIAPQRLPDTIECLKSDTGQICCHAWNIGAHKNEMNAPSLRGVYGGEVGVQRKRTNRSRICAPRKTRGDRLILRSPRSRDSSERTTSALIRTVVSLSKQAQMIIIRFPVSAQSCARRQRLRRDGRSPHLRRCRQDGYPVRLHWDRNQ